MSIRVFEGINHAATYAKFRPKPPEALIASVLEYLGQKRTPEEAPTGRRWKVAVDVGCGSGQCSSLLSPYFDRVLGVDVSPAQISEAKKGNKQANVEYQISPAETFPVPDGSVDLITCSQSFHWFDAQKFYAEAKRVLAPNGALAVFGYTMPLVEVKGRPDTKSENCKQVIRRTYRSPLLAEHWDRKERKMVDSRYADVTLPFNDMARREEGLERLIEANAEEVVGYIHSWSGYQKCLKSDPEAGAELIDDYKKNISSVTGIEILAQIPLNVYFQFFLLLNRK